MNIPQHNDSFSPGFIIRHWLSQNRSTRLTALVLLLASIGLSVTTYIVITYSDAITGPDPAVVIALILLTLLLLFLLLSMIGRRVWSLWSALRHGYAGSRLQTRILATFGMVAIIPTVLVAIFSILLFNFGIQSWFDSRVSTALEESVAVAEAYLSEHKETIRADGLAMANDIKPELSLAITNPKVFSNLLNVQTTIRNLTEAIIFNPDRVIARSELSFSLAFEQMPPHILAAANTQGIVLLTDDEEKIRALVKLDDIANIYLLIGRLVDPKVINHMVASQGAVNEYRKLKADISDIQWQLLAVFVLVALLLLLATLWYGIHIATRLIVPITTLISAADRVKAGDYAIRVAEGEEEDEIAALGRSFNRMTEQLGRQRKELMTANRQLDERRRFTEAVFSGVSSAVIALDSQRIVTITNRAAYSLLKRASDNHSLEGTALQDILPEIAELVDIAEKTPTSLAQKQITLKKAEKTFTLHVRIAVESYDNEIEGFIITLDDITPLISAQRSAAWSDVARRIAHEIKNPLTPISLSAERLQRKYATEIEDQEGFKRYINTIVKHVGDIGCMVEEFVSFARMPRPTFKEHSISRIIRDVVFSEKTVQSAIEYQLHLPEQDYMLVCDEHQVTRILINILKNAAESITQRIENDSNNNKTPQKGLICITMATANNTLLITIDDNGLGFPEDKLSTLTEPYVTTRSKGTGLGLAIVKKHMEDHGGSIELVNKDVEGAKVVLAFSCNIDVNKQQ